MNNALSAARAAAIAGVLVVAAAVTVAPPVGAAGANIVISSDMLFDTTTGTSTPAGLTGQVVDLGSGRSVTVVDAGTFTVPAGVTLRITGSRPFELRAEGDVTIAGAVNASAQSGAPGPGGGSGGAGGATAGGGAGGLGPSGGGGGGYAGSVDSFGGSGSSGQGGVGGAPGCGGSQGPTVGDGQPGSKGGDSIACQSTTATGGGGGAGGLGGYSSLAEYFSGGSGGGGGAGSSTGAGGRGGAGGGAVRLVATAVDVIGVVSADAEHGAPGAASAGGAGGGGGGGGSVVIVAPDITSASDAVTVRGGISGLGSGTTSASGGTGGAGRVLLEETPVDHAPVADDDSWTTTAGSTLQVASPGVLANDSDADNDAMSAEVVTGSSHGTLDLTIDGSFSYTPAAGFSGEDTFTYRATARGLASNIATVTLTVQPAAPEAVLAGQVQQPVDPQGGSTFSVKRGVVPVKFLLTSDGVRTCQLPAAAIAVHQLTGSATGAVDESVWTLPSDQGSAFRITDCQYVYNLAVSSLGVGRYRVDLVIDGTAAGNALFELR